MKLFPVLLIALLVVVYPSEAKPVKPKAKAASNEVGVKTVAKAKGASNEVGVKTVAKAKGASNEIGVKTVAKAKGASNEVGVKTDAKAKTPSKPKATATPAKSEIATKGKTKAKPQSTKVAASKTSAAIPNSANTPKAADQKPTIDVSAPVKGLFSKPKPLFLSPFPTLDFQQLGGSFSYPKMPEGQPPGQMTITSNLSGGGNTYVLGANQPTSVGGLGGAPVNGPEQGLQFGGTAGAGSDFSAFQPDTLSGSIFSGQVMGVPDPVNGGSEPFSFG